MAEEGQVISCHSVESWSEQINKSNAPDKLFASVCEAVADEAWRLTKRVLSLPLEVIVLFFFFSFLSLILLNQLPLHFPFSFSVLGHRLGRIRKPNQSNGRKKIYRKERIDHRSDADRDEKQRRNFDNILRPKEKLLPSSTFRPSVVR
ncbi:Thioredoxin domain-containing protein [Psidium guajava]|nr:Thioredoxin domain-containing protein [Psidium guajava]